MRKPLFPALLAGALTVVALPGAGRADEPTHDVVAGSIPLPGDPPAINAPVGTAFTYQGKLDQTGLPVSASCSFQFSLWDALSSGAQIGSTQTVTGLTVTNGLFTTTLDFGAGAFGGSARWLQIAVKCGSDPSYTTLAPRQSITPAPYAMFALGGSAGLSLPFAGTASAPGLPVFDVVNTATSGAAGIQARALNSPNAVALIGHGVANGGYFDATGPTGNGIQSYASGTGTGVYAGSPSGVAVYGGASGSAPAIEGINSGTGHGIHGKATGSNAVGVWGEAGNAGSGVFGEGNTIGNGVFGNSSADFASGVTGVSWKPTGYGGYFVNNAGGYALVGAGRVAVQVLEIQGADLVERFETTDEQREPGTVVVIDEGVPGKIHASSERYDRKVAGVISGAGGIEQGITMGQGSSLDGDTPVAMTGRVYVKCTTENGPIHPGDRLATSSLPGHAMRATDAKRADGAVIGKAMSALDDGTGLVLVLVNLQ